MSHSRARSYPPCSRGGGEKNSIRFVISQKWGAWVANRGNEIIWPVNLRKIVLSYLGVVVHFNGEKVIDGQVRGIYERIDSFSFPWNLSIFSMPDTVSCNLYRWFQRSLFLWIETLKFRTFMFLLKGYKGRYRNMYER